ncbi:MAG: iron hydrogenase small subunit [Spirochaetaceae bacterium]|nr:iron hydrogenase small subunit [Spirochaetaceae bacterium]
MINLTINGKEVSVEPGTTILQAAQQMNIKIPSLCYNKDLPAWASCGICVIKNVDPRTGRARMARACCTECTPGMNIVTNDLELTKARRTVLELILANHPDDCLKCNRSGQCELQNLAAEFGLRSNRFTKIIREQPTDASYAPIVFDRKKCISCGRCVETCQMMQNGWALEYTGRGDKTVIGPVAGADLAHSPCIRCGQCAAHCPTGAITTHTPVEEVFAKVADPELTPVVSIAPSVRAALGEEFGMPVGTITTGKIYTALRMIGFKYIFDTNFAADLTIMEEGTELVHRLTTKGSVLPMFTSCCPGWVDYAEKNYHDLLPNLSTAKSPQQMQGAITKTYWAEQVKVAPDKIFHLSIMPCTAKAYEAIRNEDMRSSGAQGIDMVLTTREFASLIRQAGIDFASLEDSEADSPIGPYSGAGTIFGATGGVMEAAVRTAYKLVTGKELGNVEYTPVRGLDGVKKAEVDLNGTKVKLAVIHQMGNVDAVVQEIRKAAAEGKERPYDFIEVMACKGGCVTGGGQPYGHCDELREKRAAALYKDDENHEIRCSHQNPLITKIYKEYFDEPNSKKAHHLLHTHYTPRDIYSNK